MKDKEGLFAIKIVLIIAIILAVVSFALPWRGFSMNFMSVNMGVDFYPWGGHIHMDVPSSLSQYNSSINSGSMNVWSIFYMINTGEIEGLSSSQGIGTLSNQNTAAIACFIISFILGLLAIIFGILSIKRNKLILVSGILSIISITAFIAGFSVGLSQDSNQAASNMIQYTIGFYLMIVSAILFFVSFGLNYAIKTIITQGAVLPFYGPSAGTEFKDSQKENIENKPVYQDYVISKKVCPECGTEMEGNPLYCINCGKKLE
jgi:uncharacterized SAM-binding protein YcdF (DUF218 family)